MNNLAHFQCIFLHILTLFTTKELVHRDQQKILHLLIPKLEQLPGCAFYKMLLFQAQQMRIENVKAFYTSDIFTGNRFAYDAQRKQIVQTVF